MDLTTDLPEVDIVIVSHNGGRALRRAVTSTTASAGVRARVFVVDNNSDHFDATELSADATVLLQDDNLGYGAGFNRGLAEAGAEWVVCSNQDVEVAPSTLATLIGAAECHERLTGAPAIVGPRLLSPDGTTAETCHNIPTLSQQMLAFMAGEALAGYRNFADPTTSGPTRCGWVSGAFILARKTTFEALDGFDPSYFMYVEDLDFFDRAAAQGIAAVWVPGATVIHTGAASRTPSADVYAHCLTNWKTYFAKRRGPLAGMAIFGAGLAGSGLRAAMWAIRGRKGDSRATELSLMFRTASLVALRTAANKSRGGRRSQSRRLGASPFRRSGDEWPTPKGARMADTRRGLR